jgi:hypothetical protein
LWVLIICVLMTYKILKIKLIQIEKQKWKFHMWIVSLSLLSTCDNIHDWFVSFCFFVCIMNFVPKKLGIVNTHLVSKNGLNSDDITRKAVDKAQPTGLWVGLATSRPSGGQHGPPQSKIAYSLFFLSKNCIFSINRGLQPARPIHPCRAEPSTREATTGIEPETSFFSTLDGGRLAVVGGRWSGGACLVLAHNLA